MYQAKISRLCHLKMCLCHLKSKTAFFLKFAWCVTVGMYWGPMGSNMLWKFFCTCYAVAKYILEASIEAKSGWPLPKPNTNYPVLSTVLEGYNYIPWPPYKPPSTEQWLHCEVLISGIKSTVSVQYLCTRMYYVPALLSEYQAGPPTLLILSLIHIWRCRRRG